MRVYVGFPIELDRSNYMEEPVDNLHITLAYWSNITAVEANKIADWIASTSVWKIWLRHYRIIDQIEPSLYGPNEDVPALRLHWYYGSAHLKDMHEHLVKNFRADSTWDYAPHVTVPLKLAIHPPKMLIQRPIHMWRGARDPHPIVRKK